MFSTSHNEKMVEVLTGAERRLNNPDSRGSYFDNNFTALEGAAEKGVITGCGYDAVMIDATLIVGGYFWLPSYLITTNVLYY